MARPQKFIPLEDIKGLKTLLNENKSQDEIAAYFSKTLCIKVTQQTISNKIKELKKDDEKQ